MVARILKLLAVSVLRNYFDPTKLSLNLYLARFLNTLAKPFVFPCLSIVREIFITEIAVKLKLKRLIDCTLY